MVKKKSEKKSETRVSGTGMRLGDKKSVIYVGRGALTFRNFPVLEQGVVTEVSPEDYDVFVNMRGVHPVKGYNTSIRSRMIQE